MIDTDRLRRCYDIAKEHLLSERNTAGHWEGELSASALSTATAIMALRKVQQARTEPNHGVAGVEQRESPNGSANDLQQVISNGLQWIADQQNKDGGWGDTVKSISNISTTMLCHAVFHACDATEQYVAIVKKATAYIDEAGGVDAVIKRYGKDKTFSVPILTHCAIAGLVDWKTIPQLPFELSVFPHRFFAALRLPVVSYALPALIAIGQVRFQKVKSWNPIMNGIRSAAKERSLQKLISIQPENGGFLEATPLTSFVTMSLASMGLHEHEVAKKGVEFLLASVRKDGSWPIDTNLATWVTTLSVNALKDDLPEADRPAIRDWLLEQQFKKVHPYTNAAPGGWAWTNLPGGVPDADDTPGALIALANLSKSRVRCADQSQPESAPAGSSNREESGVDNSSGAIAGLSSSEDQQLDDERSAQRTLPDSEDENPDSASIFIEAARQMAQNHAVIGGCDWLLGLQNSNGGFPTFCKGWGTLPFDRSAADITAHCVRALNSAKTVGETLGQSLPDVQNAIKTAFNYLEKVQRYDGSWLPLWFGNQYGHDDENPVFGTSRVLMAYRDAEMLDKTPALRGKQFLIDNQNNDGGWGGSRGIVSSVEETALAVEALAAFNDTEESIHAGANWLMDKIEDGTFTHPSPIGFYFAKLWYFEKLYPSIFTVSALRTLIYDRNDGPLAKAETTD